MKLSIRRSLILSIVGVASAIVMHPIAAFAETELVLSSWLPPRHAVTVGAIKPWAKQVEEVTEGRVTVRVLSKPLGPPPAHFDMAAKGVADITYGLHSFTTDDRFVRSRIGQFSFIGDDAATASKAFWNVYTDQLDAQKEHAGTKLLGLFVHGPGILHNNVRKIESADDFAGLKIRVPGGYISELMTDLGATTLFMSAGEVYEKLSRGVIDGVTFPDDALTSFKLTDDLKYSMTAPGGMYNTTWFLVMNEAKWNEISAEDQAAIEAISGEAFAQLVGDVWNASDARSRGIIADTDIEVHSANEAVLKAIKDAAAKHEAAWSEALAAQGYDGSAALRAMRKEAGVEF